MTKHKEYFFKEGCYIEEWQNSIEQPELSIAKVRVKANTQTRLHSLEETTEHYAIVSGDAVVTVGNKTWSVTVGDVVKINPSVSQKIHNITNKDLVFLAICTPRFQHKNYRDLDESQ